MARYNVMTAIPYVNGRPHVGHALELVQADVLARHRRQCGDEVRFQTGTDDSEPFRATLVSLGVIGFAAGIWVTEVVLDGQGWPGAIVSGFVGRRSGSGGVLGSGSGRRWGCRGWCG